MQTVYYPYFKMEKVYATGVPLNQRRSKKQKKKRKKQNENLQTKINTS